MSYGSTYSNIMDVLDPMLTVSLYDKLDSVCVVTSIHLACWVCAYSYCILHSHEECE